MKVKKILITHSYTKNRGDAAVLESMIYTLNKRVQNRLQIHVFAWDSKEAKQYYKKNYPTYNIKFYPWIYEIKKQRNLPNKIVWLFKNILLTIKLYMWAVIYKNFGRSLNLFFNKKEKEQIQAISECDIALSPGGHHFSDLNPQITVWTHCLEMRIIQLAGKKTVLYPQTIGPFFRTISKKLSRVVIKNSSAVLLREKESIKYIKELGAKNYKIRADAVFDMPLIPKDKITKILTENSIKLDNRLNVGIALYKSPYYGYPNPEEKHWQYLKTIANTCDHLIRKYRAQIIFIHMEKPGAGSDNPLIKQILPLIENKKAVRVLKNKYDSKQTASLIKLLDIFIGTKTHSVIFSLRVTTLPLAIAYHPKTTHFMKQCGLSDFVIDIDRVSECNTLDLVDKMITKRRYLEVKLKKSSEKMARLAEKAADDVIALT